MQWNDQGGSHYAKGENGRWDGDEFGNEWDCGFRIFDASDDAESLGWDLYTDDGAGNGDFLGTFSSLMEAKQAAEDFDSLDDGDSLKHGIGRVRETGMPS